MVFYYDVLIGFCMYANHREKVGAALSSYITMKHDKEAR